MAQAEPICEYLCNFVFLSLVFQYWAKVFTDVLLYCPIVNEFKDLNAKLYQMQVNAHHLEKKNWPLTMQPPEHL